MAAPPSPPPARAIPAWWKNHATRHHPFENRPHRPQRVRRARTQRACSPKGRRHDTSWHYSHIKRTRRQTDWPPLSKFLACPYRRSEEKLAQGKIDRKSTRLNSSHLGISY